LQQDAGRPVLYQHINIRSTKTISLLARTLHHYATQNEENSEYIKALDIRGANIDITHTVYQPRSRYDEEIDIACVNPSLALDLMTILTEAVNLQSLIAHGYHALAGLTIGRRTSGTTMRCLDITVKSAEVLPTLGYIAHFANLQELRLKMTLDPKLPDPFTTLRPWNLQLLQQLAVCSSGYAGFALSVFLGRCRFPALVKLKFSASLPGSEASSHLSTLFKTFNHIQNASFNVPGVDYSLFLPNLSVPSLQLLPLNAAIVTSLSSVTHTLRISSSDATRQFTDMVGILESLLANDSGIRTIWIYDDGFSWMSGENTSQLDSVPLPIALVPRLLHLAAKLSKKGIAIKDCEGKTVTDYFISS
jgi:hypothetical protein